MAILTINDPTISVGITDSNRPVSVVTVADTPITVTVSNINIPVISYGTTVYSVEVLGSTLSGLDGELGRVWTLTNTFVLKNAIVVRNGAVIQDYTLTQVGVNDTVTFSNINIFNDDVIMIMGFS